MKILIFGTGAVGSVYGVQLAKAGYDVHFYARPERQEILAKEGLILEPFFFKKRIMLSPANIKLLPNLRQDLDSFDYIFLCTRFDQLGSAANELKRAGVKDQNIVALQSGLG